MSELSDIDHASYSMTETIFFLLNNCSLASSSKTKNGVSIFLIKEVVHSGRLTVADTLNLDFSLNDQYC